jgi:hypothetical protein
MHMMIYSQINSFYLLLNLLVGKVDSVSDTVCRVKWDNIWWNLITEDNDTPALVSERSRHVLPDLIQRFL